MAHDAHKKAADHDDEAGKAHRTAADHHGKGDDKIAHELSQNAVAASTKAHESSKRAHGKSATKSGSK